MAGGRIVGGRMTPLALRFAARELRSGVKGFRIFLACLALGVAAIAAAGSTAEAFRQGLASQAREILGGDLAIDVRAARFHPGRTGGLRRLGPRRLFAARPGHGARRPPASGGWWSCAASATAIRWPGTVAAAGAAGRWPRPWRRRDGAAGRGGGAGAAGPAGPQAGRPVQRRQQRLRRPRRAGGRAGPAIARFALGPRVLTRLAAMRGARPPAARRPLRRDGAHRPAAPALDPRAAARAIAAALPGAGLEIRDRSDAAPAPGG